MSNWQGIVRDYLHDYIVFQATDDSAEAPRSGLVGFGIGR